MTVKLMTRRLAAIALVALCPVLPAAGQELMDFGTRAQGGPYNVFVDISNESCPGTHTVRLSLLNAPWLTITGANPIQVAEGASISTDGRLNLTNLTPGEHKGTLQITCTTCAAACALRPQSVAVRVYVVPPTTTFGGAANAGDRNFGGLDANGQPRTLCDLIKQIVDEVARTPWGGGSRAQKIINELRSEYMDNDCSDITFVPTIDRPGKAGKLDPVTTPIDGSAPPPGNAVYVLSKGPGPTAFLTADEEIYVGIDLTVAGVYCARQNPSEYYVFTYMGTLGTVRKADLVHTIFHEGLHAVQGGSQNVAKPGSTERASSTEEENDGFAAGNEAATALGLPPSIDTAGAGYGRGSNTGYTPVN